MSAQAAALREVFARLTTACGSNGALKDCTLESTAVTRVEGTKDKPVLQVESMPGREEIAGSTIVKPSLLVVFNISTKRGGERDGEDEKRTVSAGNADFIEVVKDIMDRNIAGLYDPMMEDLLSEPLSWSEAENDPQPDSNNCRMTLTLRLRPQTRGAR